MTNPSVERSTSSSEIANLPASGPWLNHGRTIAAWTSITVVVVGGILAALGFVVAPWLIWVGLAIVVLGIVAGKVLQMAGYGQGGKYTLARTARGRAAGRDH